MLSEHQKCLNNFTKKFLKNMRAMQNDDPTHKIYGKM